MQPRTSFEWRPWTAAVGGFMVAELLLRNREPVALTVELASWVASILRLLDIFVTQEAAVLRSPAGFAYEIGGACLALQPIAALAGLLLADRRVRRGRAVRWIIAGSLCLFVLNLVRLVCLFWLGTKSLQLALIAHDVIWPCLFTLVVFALWMRGRERRDPSGIHYATDSRIPS